ncbi:spore-associated protein A [Streptomyces sp. NPDC090306]|uniref:spore-associated protein A n=1 Tax=Streptomyces sp. NPDC090306 TaxID=3365961 RepID=UPI00380257AC
MAAMRRTAILGATGAAAAVAVLLTAPAAGADERPAASTATTYNGACGKGYNVVNSAAIGTQGTVYLTYNAGTGANCVVAQRRTAGAPVHMSASLGFSSPTTWVVDSGNYRSYAGPVYLDARGLCVTWRGQIGDEVAGKNGTNCGARVAARG